MKIILVCGARPNFIKVAALFEALGKTRDVETILVHTGQHYDERMSRQFFDELDIPRPDVNLEVGSASHAVQTSEVMKRFAPVCEHHRPDWVIVVGDVNSTLACALTAVKLAIRVAHVEAGLRSFDRAMPEEINRIVTDTVSDLLFVSEPSGMENLQLEGVEAHRIHHVGNVMIDTLLRWRNRADQSRIHAALGVKEKNYAVVTLHRPSNVDRRETLSPILAALEQIGDDMPVVFPIHPRSRARLESSGWASLADPRPNLRLIEPLGYFDFLKLMADAALVLTDSGGIQEETTILNVPCLTLRENTERPITITQGTNRLAGCRTEGILAAYREVRVRPPQVEKMPDLWDGCAARRIVECLTASGDSHVRDSKPPSSDVLAARAEARGSLLFDPLTTRPHSAMEQTITGT